MDRRAFFQAGLGSALASQIATTAGAAQTPPAAPGKLKVDAYSRHLQWLRTPDEVAEAVAEMGFDGVNITVRPYPGHVNPENVAQELPPFVNAIRKHGLEAVSITCPITDADSPNAEKIIQTASSLGITHYWWGTFRYEQGKPIIQQLDEFKPRVAKLAALNAKYKMTAMYHTYAMPGTVGAAVWDFLYVLRDFDPAQVGFHYDSGHMANHGNGLWQLNMRAANQYIVAMAFKDFTYEQDLGLKGEGGPYVPPPPGSAPPEGARGGRGGRGGGPPGAGGRRGGAQARGGSPQNAGGRGGRGGRGGADSPPATANGWRTKQVPLGTGVVSIAGVAAILKEIGFNGPMEIQHEYPMGGANNAADKITIPRAQVLGMMKRDLLALRAGFAESGLL